MISLLYFLRCMTRICSSCEHHNTHAASLCLRCAEPLNSLAEKGGYAQPYLGHVVRMPFGRVNTPSLYQAEAWSASVSSQPSHAWVERSMQLFQRARSNHASAYWISLVFSVLVVLVVSYVVSSHNTSWDAKDTLQAPPMAYAQPEPAKVSKERASNF